MGAGAQLPQEVEGAKWSIFPPYSLGLNDVVDTLRGSHAGPNIILLDMGLARSSSADTLDLGALRRTDTLILFCCKLGQEPERSEKGSLFSATFVSLLSSEGQLSANAAVGKMRSAIFEETNGAQYPFDVPGLRGAVYLKFSH